MNGDIYGMISPYITANFWVRFPSLRNQRLVIVSLCLDILTVKSGGP